MDSDLGHSEALIRLASRVQLPAPPSRLFASDNASGVHPRYLDAIAEANEGHSLAYGVDPFTTRATEAFRSLCDLEVEVFFPFGGTGANVLALSILLDRGECVLCCDTAHIAVDETGAPEKFLGSKLLSVATSDGKLLPSHIHAAARQLGNIHHVQPGVVSISQPTELGSLYSIDELKDIVSTAHHYNMRVHVDGARIANAVAALGSNSSLFRAMTFDIGVDAVSFGGTKNAMLNAEAVLVSPVYRMRRGAHLQKQTTQLPSKMRFISAQFDVALRTSLWLETATHANVAAMRLFESVSDIPSLRLAQPVVNSLYPTLLDPAKTLLQEWSFFWDWDVDAHLVRWMTSWDSSPADISAFADGVRAVCDAS